ncbi:MAG: hypothetical protein ABWY22_02485 [Flavobacterium sp.]
MKPVFKEVIWVIVLFIISYLIYNPHLIFTSESTTIDINIHDTYFVIESSNILILITVFVFYFTYLMRMLFARFKNAVINYIFLFSNILIILVILYIIQAVKMIMILPGTTIYPPLSSPPQLHQGNGLERYYHFFIKLEIGFIVTFILAGIKTIINYKKQKTLFYKN